MSTQKSALEAMLEQYETNNKPKYEKNQEKKVYDLKNYFNTYIKDGVPSATKTIRILPTASGSPFVEFHGHKVLVDGEYKTFACLKHAKDEPEPCPFCEAREALLATGKDTDKELAKKYGSRMMYIVKVIDRDNEKEGVKFWRFNHDYSKKGIMDKIHSIVSAIKKDITDPETGRDLVLTIQRDQNNRPTVTGIAQLDPSVLTENEDYKTEWLADDRTWESVYSLKGYDYLEIIVKGGVPVWDKEAKGFVDKASLSSEKTTSESLDSELTLGVENVKSSIQTAKVLEEQPSGNTEDTEDDLPF